ncbi:DNA polymerase III subunit gamma/tau [Glaciecola siphonariae]|uniref:DNA-directed DNA polymerase n=1 Tax=Glaciecola siphonariae TaxID=521012 RepID=A0ABV9LYT4_9ALTE
MSYQVLARKWRPQTFSELVGQQHVVDAITNALDNDKLHHAYLFTGTRGVGKTTIARIFSKSLNCEEGQSANPCGKCATCMDISEGRFVDLLEIDAASRTKVEDTRELLDNVQYKPTRGKYKVYLIDEVHMLSKHSFNALLKTLEEPPPHVKFLLATTDPQKLPVTILSRCLQFSLKSLSREQIQSQLAYILTEDSLPYEAPALSQIARAASGSMRDALSLTDQAIAQGNNRVTLNTVISMLGLLDKNQILRLAKCICERDAHGAMEQLEEICADSPDYSQVLSQLLALLHQVALTQIVPDICKLDTNVAKPIYTLSKAVGAEHIQLLYQIGLNGKRDLPFAPDAFTGLQMTIMRMLAFTPAQNIPLEISELPSPSEQAPLESKIQSSTAELAVDDSLVSGSAVEAQAETHDSRLKDELTEVDAVASPDLPVDSGQSEDIDAQKSLEATKQTADSGSHKNITGENDEPAALTHSMEDEETAKLASLQAYEPHDTAGADVSDSFAGVDDLNYQAPNYQTPIDNDTQTDAARDTSKSAAETSNLQDLFDLESDLDSYEQQALEEEKGKKSEPGLAQKAENEADALTANLSEPIAPQTPESKPIATASANEQDGADVAVSPPWNESLQPSSEPVSHNDSSHQDDEGINSDGDVANRTSTNDFVNTPQPDTVSAVDEPVDAPEVSTQNQDVDSARDEKSVNTSSPEALSNSDPKSAIQPYLPNGEKLVLASQIDKWSHFVDSIGVRGLARQLLIHGRSPGIKDQCLLLEINQSHHHLNEESSISTIKQALAEKFNREIDVKVEYADVSDSPYEIQQQIDAMRLSYAQQTIATDSAFQELMKAFDAQVIPESIESR